MEMNKHECEEIKPGNVLVFHDENKSWFLICLFSRGDMVWNVPNGYYLLMNSGGVIDWYNRDSVHQPFDKV